MLAHAGTVTLLRNAAASREWSVRTGLTLLQRTRVPPLLSATYSVFNQPLQLPGVAPSVLTAPVILTLQVFAVCFTSLVNQPPSSGW